MTDATDPFFYSPGANDNASGIAGMLEIARVIKKRGFVPASTIEFVAFASEEYELNGSDDYVNKASATNKNIVMMLNLDMIAYDPQTDPAKWIVNVMDYGNSTGLRTMFVKCGRTYTNLNFSHNNDYIEDGDSYSFYKKGYQALFIINDAEDSYYHTPDDIIGHYNFPFCKAVTSVACALLVQENK
jgi:leucyl aminopeptidase